MRNKLRTRVLKYGRAWVLLAAAAPIDASVMEARARGVGNSVHAHHAIRRWWVGLLALLPARGIALVGYAAPR